MRERKFIYTTILVIFYLGSYGQNRQIDSLTGLINKMNNTRDQIEISNDLASAYLDVNLDSAKKYMDDYYSLILEDGNIDDYFYYYMIRSRYYSHLNNYEMALKQCKLARKYLSDEKEKERLIQIYNFEGQTFVDSGLYDEAIKTLTQSLEMNNDSSQLFQKGATYNSLAIVYDDLGENTKALDYYFKALEIFKYFDQKYAIATLYNNIGSLYSTFERYDEAIEYFSKAIDINLRLNNSYHLSMAYNSLGISYKETKQYDKAIDVLEKALLVAQESGYIYSLTQTYNNLGSVYQAMEEYEKAIHNFEKSYNLSLENNIHLGLFYNSIGLGEAHLLLKNYDLSEKYFNEALSLKEGVALNNEVLLTLYEDISELNTATSDYQTALAFYKKYTKLKDSIFSTEKTKQVNELREKYESEQKQKKNEKLLLQNELKTKAVQRKNMIIMAILIFLVFLVIIILVLYRLQQKKQENILLLRSKNEEIEKQSRELRKLNSTKDMFFSIIAHDLRNPFHTLLGFSSLIKEDLAAGNYDKVNMYAELIHENSNRGFVLLENLLNWSMSQKGEIPFQKVKTNIYELVNETLSLLMEQARLKKITIENKINPDLEIQIDVNMIKLVFRNLIANAIKFSYEYGNISLMSRTEENMHNFTVLDNGCGITEENLPKLFEIESHISTYGTHEEKGSGLGLILCKEFIEKHNGNIRVESTVGKGTEFSFSLPVS